MTNVDEKYLDLLRYFNVKSHYEGLLETVSYVSMDNIHDAILSVGVAMQQPLNYYIVKAKQYAINEYTATNRRYRIIMENISRFIGGDFEGDIVHEYGFNEIELDLIMELLQGIKAYKSSIPRRQYYKVLDAIRDKVKATL